MAAGGGGGAPALPPAPLCPPQWKAFFSSLVTLLRQMEAQGIAFGVEHTRLLAEIELLKRVQSQRLEVAEDTIQEIRRGASLKEEATELLEPKESAARDSDLDEFGDNCLEYFRSLSTLVDENTELKKKLELERQAELTENAVDHQRSAKDLRADLRKLKQAYKTMVSEKDKEISAIRAEKEFVWNQYKTLEEEFKSTCSTKNIELKRANEAAKELEKTVRDLQLKVREKDDEISRLQQEAVSTKESMLVKSKDAETDKSETHQKQKKDLYMRNRKSKLEGSVSREKSGIPHSTPVRTDVKSTRKCVACAKGTCGLSGNNSCMHNTVERGEYDSSQKRKRGSSTSSHSLWRCSARQQIRHAQSPMLYTPHFTAPKVTARIPRKF